MDHSISVRAYNFALGVIRYYKTESRKDNLLAKQLLRSATSIGANYEEAVGGYSTKEFRAKVSIAYKEAREAKYWIRLLNDSGDMPQGTYTDLFDQADHLCAILFKVVRNTKI